MTPTSYAVVADGGCVYGVFGSKDTAREFRNAMDAPEDHFVFIVTLDEEWHVRRAARAAEEAS